MIAKKNRRPQLLSSTRPRINKSPSSLSSRATRSLVRKHHILRKELSTARAGNDTSVASSMKAQLDALGGLEKYQEASLQGQSTQRGGDSSKVLVEWILDKNVTSTKRCLGWKRLRMLEVGALKIDNICSRSGLFDIERIDLHSQHPEIKEQDFMDRPPPTAVGIHEDGFDIVSLSLVVNFVGDSQERGEMLKRVAKFLRPDKNGDMAKERVWPGLFLVLPAPCLINSRYLDEAKLEDMMRSLGYSKARRKISAKLVYYLWRFDGLQELKAFKKERIRPGNSRNNFAIALR